MKNIAAITGIFMTAALAVPAQASLGPAAVDATAACSKDRKCVDALADDIFKAGKDLAMAIPEGEPLVYDLTLLRDCSTLGADTRWEQNVGAAADNLIEKGNACLVSIEEAEKGLGDKVPHQDVQQLRARLNALKAGF